MESVRPTSTSTLAKPALRVSTYRAAGFACGVLVLGFLAWVLLRVGGDQVTTAVDDLGQLAALVGGGLCLWTAALSRGRQRRAWGMLGLAALSWALGEVYWSYLEVVRGQLSPFPSLADIGFLGAAPLEIAAVLHFFRGQGGAASWLRIGLDGLVLASALFFVSWILVLRSTFDAGDSPFNTALSLAYPVADIVTLVVVIETLTESREVDSPLTYVMAGLVALTVSDTAFTYLTAINALSTTAVDTGWVAGFLLLGVGALRAQVRTEAAARGPRFSEARSLLPYVPVLGSVALGGFQFLRFGRLDPVGVGAGIIMVTLVLLRQVFALREVGALSQRLESTISTLREREQELTFQAFHDPLTSLANRALFRDRLEHAIASARRGPRAMAVFFLDLDDFKTVNDSLGHDAGDRLLLAVGERLRACVRPGDTTARLGGDEFAVLLAGSPGREEVEGVARRILQAFEVPFTLEQDFLVGISIGIVISEDPGATGVELLRQADVAMYAAKDAGKARYAFFGEDG